VVATIHQASLANLVKMATNMAKMATGGHVSRTAKNPVKTPKVAKMATVRTPRTWAPPQRD
jgi:hypothetical protein